MKARWFLLAGSHMLLKWEGIDVPLIMHVWKKGKCRQEQLQWTPPPSLPPMPPPVFTHSSFLACAQTAVDDAAVGRGAYLSRSLALPTLSVQMKAECIYSPACHPAASGRGITLATMNKRDLIQKQALARWVTHCHTGRVHHTFAAGVFCWVRVFLFVWQISLQYYEDFDQIQESLNG